MAVILQKKNSKFSRLIKLSGIVKYLLEVSNINYRYKYIASYKCRTRKSEKWRQF